MKLKEFLEAINKFGMNNPDYMDFEVVVTSYDEFNPYELVSREPSRGGTLMVKNIGQNVLQTQKSMPYA